LRQNTISSSFAVRQSRVVGLRAERLEYRHPPVDDRQRLHLAPCALVGVAEV
jgi:hypothetical protein